MINLKNRQIRSRKYLDGAKGQSCVMCGADDGTIVSAHYSGLHANQFGKGAGIKAQDLFVADLCRRGRDEVNAFNFLKAILKTQERRFEQGLLMIKGAK